MPSALSRTGVLSSSHARSPNPKFSIVIPCHNEAKYAPKLLQALENQTFPLTEFEVIVVDNNSSDNTAATIWRFAENTRLKLRMVHEHHLGVSNARNTGANDSSGETIVFLDADNLVSPNFLDNLKELMATNRCIAGTFKTLPDQSDLKGNFVFWALEIIKCHLHRPFGKSFVRRDIFHHVNGFNENIALGENVDFLTRVKKLVRDESEVFGHVRKPIFCSLRRFSKHGYMRILLPWLLAYLGFMRLRYRTMASIDAH